MRRLNILGALLLLFVTGSSVAQQKISPDRWRFQSVNSVGILEGQTGSAFQIQTVNGVCYQSWYAGVGLGLDYYRFRTIPLFMDIRKEFGKSSNKLFLYLDGGISFAWVTDDQKMPYNFEHFSNGFYDDMGIGYKALLGKKNALQISLGYTYKQLTDTYSSIFYYNDLPPVYPPQKLNYSLNRLSIKLGWSF